MAKTATVISGDLTLLRQINRGALLRVIRQQPGLSRAELAEVTGLTRATVGTLVQELEGEGWLSSGEQRVNGPGRPSSPLFLAADKGVLLGAEIAVDHCRIVAINPLGERLGGRVIPWPLLAEEVQVSPGEAVAMLAQALAELVRTFPRRLLGIGVGVPGPINPAGLLHLAPNLGWRDVPMRELLLAALTERGLNVPLLVENEANAGAMSEYVFGVGALGGSLLYLSLGVGVGGGIVLRDQLYPGEDGYAGEFGHLSLSPDGPLCRCGNRGCAETLVGQRVLSQYAFGRPDADLDDMLAALQQGQEAMQQAAQDAGRYLGVLISNLIHAFNPQTVVLGGPLAELGDPLLLPTLQETRRRTMPHPYERTHIRLSAFGRDACAIGAAAHVLHDLLSPWTPQNASAPPDLAAQP